MISLPPKFDDDWRTLVVSRPTIEAIAEPAEPSQPVLGMNVAPNPLGAIRVVIEDDATERRRRAHQIAQLGGTAVVFEGDGEGWKITTYHRKG